MQKKCLYFLLFISIAKFIHAAPHVYILGDMEKPTGDERVGNSPEFFQDGTITLHGAGNEVVAFQALLQAERPEESLDARISDLSGPDLIPTRPNIRIFRAHYIRTADASYSWFPPGGAGVLPWRGRLRPDALIPLVDPYDPAAPPVATPFSIDPARHRNQALWIDIFIPKDTPAGRYDGRLELLQDGKSFANLPVALRVHSFNLPDEHHVDAYGELYRENGVMFDTGVKFKVQPDREWAIYKRYIQMGHAHRFLALHRAENGPLPTTPQGGPADRSDKPWGENWRLYTPYVGKILDGRLFTAEEGYTGPRAGTPPSFYPAPFIETFYGAKSLRRHLAEQNGRIDPGLLATWRANAAAFWAEVTVQGWQDVRFFAYIMDEVDGPRDAEAGGGSALDEIIQFHRAMGEIQQALDQGTDGRRRIHLLWTSHADAADWAGTPADLRPVISWWAPNGHALNVPFYHKIAAQSGQHVWFYHSGHPAVGNHTINQLGIDLRLWGLLCRRYKVGGSFWWSMAAFGGRWDDPAFNPYENPVYKRGETRWGNGVLFYPGARLTMLGCRRNVAGPIPSLRMKAYRRGLQDYEYAWLADQRGHREDVDRLLKELIPTAFSEAPQGRKRGRWSQNPADYYQLRRRLAELIVDESDQ